MRKKQEMRSLQRFGGCVGESGLCIFVSGLFFPTGYFRNEPFLNLYHDKHH